MGILDQAKTEMQPRPGALFGLFNKHEQLTPEQVDRRYKQGAVLSALGMGLSQLGAGQPVNMSPAFEGLQKRQQQAQLRKVMEQPGLMDGFSPQQRAILATMPESMAVELIMQRAFAPPPDPTRGIEINDQLVNPITGESMGDYRTPETTDRKTAQDINGVLRYVDTGEPVFPNVAAEPPTPKQTDDMAEYAAAVSQGYGGSLQDWLLEQKKAGASSQIVNVGSGPSGSQALAAVAMDPQTMISSIDAIYNDPALPKITGTIEGGGGNDVDQFGIARRLYYGEDGLALIQRVKQLQDTVFMSAREMLKGGGQITDFEGRKAEAAMARMSRAQGEKEFKEALKDLRDAITAGQAKLQAATGGASTPNALPAATHKYNPQTGQIEVIK
mgnify:CR=1 FL=1